MSHVLTAEQAQQIEEALHNIGNALMCLTATRKLRPMYQEMRDDAVDGCNKALATIRAARAQADHIAGAGKVIGCAYCDNPLFAGTKCNNCGRVTLAEQAEKEPFKMICLRCKVDRVTTQCPNRGGIGDCPMTATAQSAVPVEQAEQEPVAWRVRGYNQFKTGNPAPWRYVDGTDKPTVNMPDCCDFEPTYAAPVRTKDLTDDEIDEIFAEYGIIPNTKAVRAVIAADREKNK